MGVIVIVKFLMLGIGNIFFLFFSSVLSTCTKYVEKKKEIKRFPIVCNSFFSCSFTVSVGRLRRASLFVLIAVVLKRLVLWEDV